MNIFVSEKLLTLKKEFKKRGYNIYNNNTYDVIVCDLKRDISIDIYLKGNLKTTDILVIDGAGKTIDEIEDIFNNRIY